MWFKKKSQISGYNPNTGYNGTDFRTTGITKNWPISSTPLSAADANNYFFLPNLGQYVSGQLDGVGGYGCYWSSSADSWNSNGAYCLYFNFNSVWVRYDYRSNGLRAGVFE